MKGLKKFLWFLYKCFACYTLLIYIMILWLPLKGWLAGFMMMSFPVVVIIHLISIPIWLIIDTKKALVPLGMLALACIFQPRTFSFGHQDKQETAVSTFSVLNYNVHSFRRYENWWNRELQNSVVEMKDWIADTDADVLCLAEYFSSNEQPFNVNKTLKARGYKYQTFYTRPKEEHHTNSWGVAILSKYPIIASHDTIFEAQNGMIRADVNIKGKTVRVIAVHLYSMTLKLSNLVHQKQVEGVKREGKSTLKRMQTGFVKRAAEQAALESWIKASPHPVIVCGDFNEIPYGYVYSKMRGILTNGFEQKGEGFGFTYNHLPYFIRIDHQFFSGNNLQILDFQTFNNVDYSDHYPVMGKYAFAKPESKE